MWDACEAVETWPTAALRQWGRQRIEELGYRGEARQYALDLVASISQEDSMAFLTPSDRQLWNRGLVLLRQMEQAGLIVMNHERHSPFGEHVVATLAVPLYRQPQRRAA